MGSSSSPGESAGLNRRWRLGRRSAWPLVALIIVLLQSLPLSPGNSAQQERVLVNLIGDACDALVDRPRRPISLSARRDGAVVRLRVQDSGPGIENEQLQRIFDPFFATTESGLGLSISHTIAQRLGGSLKAGNPADGGAVFTLTLDAWDETPAAVRAGER